MTNIKCWFAGHIWWIEVSHFDPMDVGRTTFSNYTIDTYRATCLKCGKSDEIKKTRIIPEGSQELNNRRSRRWMDQIDRELEQIRK